MPAHLHVILGYRSRFDMANGVFSGPGHDLLREYCDERQLTLTAGYAGEKVPTADYYLVCGPKAWSSFGREERHVGVVFSIANKPAICTFHPQDACDVRNIEADFQGLEDTDEDDDASNGKDSAQTQRANYRFWIAAHLDKLLRGESQTSAFNFIPAPPTKVRTTSQYLYLDIETHPPTDTVQCFSVAFDDGPVFGVQVYDHNGRLQPYALESMCWLARAMRRHTVVIHNAFFDLPFLAMMHGIPWGQSIHDTMLMWHRCFPEADKSLAHLIQFFTNEPYHKDSSGTFTPHNAQQADKLLLYNARDVHTLRLVHKGLLKYWSPSMAQVCESIPTYLYAGLRGFQLNRTKWFAHKRELEAKIKQYTRIFHILVGEPINPNSGKQIGEWLFNGLSYKPHDVTESGAPKTDATELYKQLAKHEHNVALVVLLHIKELGKQLSMLDFEPWEQPAKR